MQLSWELTEKMEGSVSATSEVGVGSKFTCVIPFKLQSIESAVREDSVELVRNEQPPLTATPINAKFDLEVLVVEDNLINQKISKILLEQIGCRVDIADCAKAAFEKLKKTYDMVFMDIGLPDMDGFQAVEKIRREEVADKHVPIVAMTAHVFAHDRERCFRVGMDEVIAKPIMRDDLIDILKRCSEGGRAGLSLYNEHHA